MVLKFITLCHTHIPLIIPYMHNNNTKRAEHISCFFNWYPSSLSLSDPASVTLSYKGFGLLNLQMQNFTFLPREYLRRDSKCRPPDAIESSIVGLLNLKRNERSVINSEFCFWQSVSPAWSHLTSHILSWVGKYQN